jgi:hypothetical protein
LHLTKGENMSKTRRYVVRGGTHNGKYITLAAHGQRKYSWANLKTKAVLLTYEQARGVVRRYGGEAVVA